VARAAWATTAACGVDRLHPAKGIEERLTAFDELLDERRLDPGDSVLVQVVAPDPVETGFYRQLRARIERQVGQINGKHGRVGHPVLHYLYRTLDRTDLVRQYRAADVMVATPLCDGMSLTAKEYVSARLDNSGAVVLSEFTATADDLPQAHIVRARPVRRALTPCWSRRRPPSHPRRRAIADRWFVR
jgi:trehalose-6-phosphate synthase